jgi:hypothetical protein
MCVKSSNVDFDMLKKQLMEDFDGDLETSGGLTPIDLAQAWDELNCLLSNDEIIPGLKDLKDSIGKLIDVMTECHTKNNDD